MTTMGSLPLCRSLLKARPRRPLPRCRLSDHQRKHGFGPDLRRVSRRRPRDGQQPPLRRTAAASRVRPQGPGRAARVNPGRRLTRCPLAGVLGRWRLEAQTSCAPFTPSNGTPALRKKLVAELRRRGRLDDGDVAQRSSSAHEHRMSGELALGCAPILTGRQHVLPVGLGQSQDRHVVLPPPEPVGERRHGLARRRAPGTAGMTFEPVTATTTPATLCDDSSPGTLRGSRHPRQSAERPTVQRGPNRREGCYSASATRSSAGR